MSETPRTRAASTQTQNDNRPIRLSVLVPFFNHKAFVAECLDSVKALKGMPLELCIIDDGSDAEHREALEEWIVANTSQLPINYRTRANKGVTATLNELIKMSTGDYVYVMASDDRVLEGVDFTKVFAFMEARSALMCVCDCKVIDDGSNDLHPSNANLNGIPSLEDYNGNALSLILRKWFFAGAIVVYDRKIFEQVGFFDEDLLIEDWDYFIRAASRRYLVFMDYRISGYRLHGANAHANVARRQAHFESLFLTCRKNLPNLTGVNKMYAYLLAIVYFFRARM